MKSFLKVMVWQIALGCLSGLGSGFAEPAGMEAFSPAVTAERFESRKTWTPQGWRVPENLILPAVEARKMKRVKPEKEVSASTAFNRQFAAVRYMMRCA